MSTENNLESLGIDTSDPALAGNVLQPSEQYDDAALQAVYDTAFRLGKEMWAKTLLEEENRSLHKKIVSQGQEFVAEREELEQKAYFDPVTGLPNRLAFEEELHHRLQDGKMLALAEIDITRFKTVNDTLGHPRGDKALRSVAEAIDSHVRGDDFVARTGGDEISIIFDVTARTDTRLTPQQRIELAVENLNKALNENLAEDDLAPLKVGAAIGIAVYESGMTDEELIKAADDAMYVQKARQYNELGLDRRT